MTKCLDLSVAISTIDRPDKIEQCMSALVAPKAIPVEIVVVDQSASDETERVVSRFAGGASEIVYVRQKGGGLAASQNLAVRTARRDIVAVIDDDCVPDESWAARIVETFASSPELDLVTGRVLPLGRPRAGFYPVSSRTSTQRADFVGKVAPWAVGSGNNFAVRRHAFLRIGGCDERLGPGTPGRGGVDMDLFYRLIRAGGSARYEPSVLVFHEQQSLEGRMRRRPLYGYGTGACFTFWMREGDMRAIPLLIQWLAWRSARMAKAALRGDRLRVREEGLMIGWTFRGLGYGLRTPVRNVSEPR